MHAGVFGARISEEAFQILFDLMQSNFAALNIPDENQVGNNKKVQVIRRRSSTVIFRENINLKLSKLIKSPQSQEIRGVFEIVLPIFRGPWPDQIIMSGIKSLDDSHEPMEIEEISLNESSEKISKPFIKKEKDFENAVESQSSEVLNPKIKILRESKLTKVLEGQKTPEVDRGLQKDDKKTAGINSEDLSEPQNTKSEVSEGSEREKMKSRLRPLVKKHESKIKETEKSSFYYFWQMLFFILFPTAVLIACVSIAREEFGSETCAHEFNATNAIRDLENRVFGQSRGIQELGMHLSSNSSGLKIVGIIGGTGVGKSYAAHIVSENFPAKKNVFQYVPPFKPRRRFASSAISVCGCNLIILENINNRDISEAVSFAEYLAGRIDNENYCVLIMNVINVQVTDNDLKHVVNLAKSTAAIENLYREKNLDVKIVQFDQLDDGAITRCILDAAKNRNLTLSKNEIDDVRISLKISDSGCKGAHAKVQLFDKKLDLMI